VAVAFVAAHFLVEQPDTRGEGRAALQSLHKRRGLTAAQQAYLAQAIANLPPPDPAAVAADEPRI
jgi:hypothetical protein